MGLPERTQWYLQCLFTLDDGITNGYSPNHLKTRPDFKGFLTKWKPFVQISNGRAPGFQIPFETQPLFNHLESRLVQISDPHCTPIWQTCVESNKTFRASL